jgi:hypothetical protein
MSSSSAGGGVGEPFLDVGLQFLGEFKPVGLIGNGNLDGFGLERALGHGDFAFDLDEVLDQVGIGDVLLGIF